MALKTDYKDDVFSGDRKYQKKDNSDGTISLVDKTAYSQKGDTFSAADINATNKAVNSLSAVATTSASGLMSAADKAKLDDLKVGGRNLLTNTKRELSGNYPASGLSDVVRYNNIALSADATHFVLSFDAKSTVDGDKINSNFFGKSYNTIKSEASSGRVWYSGDGQAITTITTEWRRYWIKWTVPGDDIGNVIIFRIRAGEGTGTVSMRNIKFETGTVPTDWTPAPEDLDGKIDELNKNGPNVLQEYVNSPTSANDIPGDDLKLKWFRSTDDMKEGAPNGYGYIIQLSWSWGWQSQLYIPCLGSGRNLGPQFRMHNANSKEWSKWVNIYSEYSPQSSATKSFTISASSWSSGSYTISDSLITETSNQEILPATNITADQMKALQKANIIDSGQSAGSLTLKALGTVPTIDIPIRVIFRGTI